MRALTDAGLMVIPNCHLLFQGWCCSDHDGNGLWWNGNWPSSRFTNDWLTVAAAFASNPLVIGYDLKNEPRTATFGGTTYTPSWGDGNSDTATVPNFHTESSIGSRGEVGCCSAGIPSTALRASSAGLCQDYVGIFRIR